MYAEERKSYESDPWWTEHLVWLMDNKPDLVERLSSTPNKRGLRDYLNLKVKNARELAYNIQKQGLESHQIEELVYAQVIGPSPPENPPDPVPEKKRLSLLDWAENLPEY
jgi:hypothetical protein